MEILTLIFGSKLWPTELKLITFVVYKMLMKHLEENIK